VDLITNKTYPMGTNEILLWQAQNEGIELFLKNNIAQKLDKGLTIQEIADRLDIGIDRVIEIINKFGLNQ
jgi:transposase